MAAARVVPSSPVYWDVESGGIDLEARSQGTAYQAVHQRQASPATAAWPTCWPRPRSPAPRFAVDVVCEDVEHRAPATPWFPCKWKRRLLHEHGIPLFATDEHADIAGVNSAALLVRRVEQGVAEWYRLKLQREQPGKGCTEHNAAGWNIGGPPLGTPPRRHQHPSPVKAGPGHTKTRLVTDPEADSFRQADLHLAHHQQKLRRAHVTIRLNAGPGPLPGSAGWGGWVDRRGRPTRSWPNPKYTGHQVYGRRTKRNGFRRLVPPSMAVETPPRPPEPIISMETWKAAQI